MASILKRNPDAITTADPSPVSFNLHDVKQRANDYLEGVRQAATEIVCQAEKDAEQIRQQAKLEGLAAAEAEFHARVQEAAHQLSDRRCRTAIVSCENAVERLNEETAKWLSAWRDQTVSLAKLMAEKLIRREAEHNAASVLQIWLEEALSLNRQSRQLRICVHPDDFTVAGQLLEHIAKSIPQAATAEVIPDPEVELGGCVVHSSHGQIDQQISTQLTRLAEQLA